MKKVIDRRGFLALLFLIVGSGAAFSQEPILLSYQRNFVRASLEAKTGILQDAATDSRSGEFMDTLYDFALDFILDNGEFMYEDSSMINLTGVVARGIGAAGYTESSETLWKVFLVFRDPYTRVEILETLVSFGQEPLFIENLNQFIISQSDSSRAGDAVDSITLSACISALVKMGDASSFMPLFSGLTAGYSQAINLEIQQALEFLTDNYRMTLEDIIYKNPPEEKYIAFILGTQSKKLTAQERGGLAQIALEISLDFEASDEKTQEEINLLRYEAIRVLTGQNWTRVSPLAIRHFYRIQTDFQKDAALKDRFLEAITCLGAMGTAESAQVLALQLGYFNSRAEYSGEYDYDIVLALVKALGEIGDKSAFDYLLYISYLNYPEQIQSAAREAMDRLQW